MSVTKYNLCLKFIQYSIAYARIKIFAVEKKTVFVNKGNKKILKKELRLWEKNRVNMKRKEILFCVFSASPLFLYFLEQITLRVSKREKVNLFISFSQLN